MTSPLKKFIFKAMIFKFKNLISLKGQKGFTLIELMVAAAGISALSVLGLLLSDNLRKVTSKTALDSDILLTTSEINTLLSDPVKCFSTLGGKNALSTVSGINAINTNRYYSVDSGAAPSIGYGNSKFKIQNYVLEATPSDLLSNNSFLFIDYQNNAFSKKSSTPYLIRKKVNLYVEVDADNKITKCRSLATSSSDIWTRGSGTSIYYNGGNVGIGVIDPKASLETSGPIKPGSAQMGSPCSGQFVGAIAVDSVSNKLLICKY